MNTSTRTHFSYVAFTQTANEQIDLAILADRLGFDGMWFGEHIVLPLGTENVYMPNAESDPAKAFGLPRSVYDETTKFFDMAALMGAIARETRSMSIMTGIYLATLRHPLITARFMETMADLSGGRFQLGVGTGWNRSEMEALGGDFDNRGKIMDETVDILRAARLGGPIEYHGEHFSFGPVLIGSKPFDVPLLFGGHSAPALRRAARVGDGWLSSLSNDVGELVQLTKRIEALREEMGTADRRFDSWIKLTTIDPNEIEWLQRSGISRFQLVGDKLLGPRDASFATRCDCLRKVATMLRLDPR
jgi:probable F420-dependent oxidoreductase